MKLQFLLNHRIFLEVEISIFRRLFSTTFFSTIRKRRTRTHCFTRPPASYTHPWHTSSFSPAPLDTCGLLSFCTQRHEPSRFLKSWLFGRCPYTGLPGTKSGVSNSNQYEGRILTKMKLAGRTKTKNVSAGRKRGEKCLNITIYCNFYYNMRAFDDDAGRTNTSGEPHAARRPRVWDPCFRAW